MNLAIILMKGSAMKQTLKTSQTVQQKLILSTKMKDSLDTLSMDRSSLLVMLQEVTQNNPVFDFTPNYSNEDSFFELASTGISLRDELYLQLHTSNAYYDEEVCSFIIESLNEHGFLSDSIEDYIHTLQIDTSTFMANLALIQSFEPIGVAARNSIDSICIQLQYKGYDEAANLLKEYPKELANKEYSNIIKNTSYSKHDIDLFLKQIQTCNPYPCSNYTTINQQVITPEFKVEIDEHTIELIPNDLGHVYVLDEYKEYTEELKSYFQEAYFYIDAISKRNQTLMVLANALFHIQKSHFLYNDELQPCSLKKLADLTGFHESTVSRTLSNKYYEFGEQVLPLKHLFVSQTKGGTSKDALIKAIKLLIEQEDPNAPLTDDELVVLLDEMELNVSRRTIAKYRKQLNIPNSNKRKRK